MTRCRDASGERIRACEIGIPEREAVSNAERAVDDEDLLGGIHDTWCPLRDHDDGRQLVRAQSAAIARLSRLHLCGVHELLEAGRLPSRIRYMAELRVSSCRVLVVAV